MYNTNDRMFFEERIYMNKEIKKDKPYNAKIKDW